MGVLKHITREMIPMIFQNTNVSLGIQVEFFYHWQQWLKQTGNKTNTIIIEQDVQEQHKCHFNVQNQANVNDQKGSILNINNILSSEPYGPAVLSYYKEHRCLNDNIRKVLLEAFLHYCITTGCNVTKAACRSIANEIQEIFNGEVAVSITALFYYYKFLTFDFFFEGVLLCPQKKWSAIG